MTKKYSTEEPAERPFNVQLSESEVVAIANWHLKVAKAIPTKLGKITLGVNQDGFQKTPTKQIFDEARKQISAHNVRARGLLSFLESRKS